MFFSKAIWAISIASLVEKRSVGVKKRPSIFGHPYDHVPLINRSFYGPNAKMAPRKKKRPQQSSNGQLMAKTHSKADQGSVQSLLIIPSN